MERDDTKGESAAERARRRRAERAAKATAAGTTAPDESARNREDDDVDDGVPPAAPRAVELNPYAAPSHDESLPRSQASKRQVLASRGSRFFARLADQIFALTLGGGIAVGLLGTNLSSFQNPTTIAVILLPGLAVDWVLITTRGQSVGKILLKIKIVQDSGEPVGFVRGVVLRDWIPFGLQLVPLLGAIFPLVDALRIFGEERKCLHDKIAGTRVVEA